MLLNRLTPRTRLGDRFLSRLAFVKAHGRPPSLDGGFNDAIYFLKTGDDALDPLRAFTSDKWLVKLYVRSLVGDQYNVPTLALVDGDVRNFAFPEHCVIKPTHMSGQVMFRRNGELLDYDRMDDWLATNYYHWTRQVNHLRLKPRIICEPFIFGRSDCEDYKFLCVNGEPKMLWVDLYRHNPPRKRNLYTLDWHPVEAELTRPRGPELPRPENLDEMISVARALSSEFPLVRVDLYSDNRQIFVGELTHYSADGLAKFRSGEDVVTRLLFGPGGVRELLDKKQRQKRESCSFHLPFTAATPSRYTESHSSQC